MTDNDQTLSREWLAEKLQRDQEQRQKEEQEARELRDLEDIEAELKNDGVAPEDARALAPSIRRERIKENAVTRAEANRQLASRQVRNYF